MLSLNGVRRMPVNPADLKLRFVEQTDTWQRWARRRADFYLWYESKTDCWCCVVEHNRSPDRQSPIFTNLEVAVTWAQLEGWMDG